MEVNFHEIWGKIREKFPPARAVAILTPLLLPLIAAFNAYLLDHFPWIADQVGPDEVNVIVVGTLVSGVGLAYKWLDGRAKWETSQIQAQVDIAKANADPQTQLIEQADIPAVYPPPPTPDSAFVLSQPGDDIDPSDSTDEVEEDRADLVDTDPTDAGPRKP